MIVPYIPKRWAILLLPFNSEVVKTSLDSVFTAIDVFSNVLKVFVADFLDFSENV